MNSALRLWLAIAFHSAWLLAADWPQWRGPNQNGRVPEGVAAPKTLPQAPGVVWRIRIGDGFGSPVVSGGRVFYLDNQQGKECVHAVQTASGKELWRAPLDQAFKDTQSVAGPRSTPVADQERVYAQSCRGEFRCLNTADGELVWGANFARDFGAVFIGEYGSAVGASRHGYTGSPVIDGDRIIVGVGGTNGASVVCFNKRNGEVIWKSQNDVPGHSGPVIADIGGVKQLVSFTAEAVIGLEASHGALLWRHPVKTRLGRHIATPVIVGDMVMVASFQAGLIGIKIRHDENRFKAEQAWVARDSAINFSSPVAIGHHLYGVGPARDLICVDIQTGKLAWAKDGFFTSPPGRTHASFLVMGDAILVLTDTGWLVLIAPDPAECRELSRVQVCGANWCNPAYADGRLYLRDAQELLCLQLLP